MFFWILKKTYKNVKKPTYIVSQAT